MNYLQLGDSGRDVEVWQRFLARVWVVELDEMLLGTFDERTDEATRAFQEQNGLDATGILDRPTLEQARARGLDYDNTLVPGGISLRTALLGFLLFVLAIVLAQCMLSAPPGRAVGALPHAPGAAATAVASLAGPASPHPA